MLSLVDRLRRFFSTSPPDTPPPGGMTFEQRAALIGALYDLKTRGAAGWTNGALSCNELYRSRSVLVRLRTP